ncbi:MAG: nucleotide sugar dehydrogenase [Nanoarchaeota archaeon]|nr:nucleotide sugar dehydrogenase [Nanoarchaeota archaeon]
MENKTICVVGLGYVGLPLAVKFGETNIKTYGLDLKKEKIEELKNNYDSMNEVSKEELENTNVEYTNNPECISKANFIIVAVPTPIDNAKKPDITLLEKASQMIGKYIQKGSIVVYESTVYPGCTQEDCVPIIEKTSNLKCGKDWFVGYSPERVNPGDKEHTIDKIVKVVSGMDENVLEEIAQTYETIIKAGVHRSSSIKVAEAAKVIENTQRDLNIALMNELSIIFEKINISTKEVLAAAGTKWNFLKFTPGLVGGHCIGVDPYYLVHKAELIGYHPQIISAGRKINDDMPLFVANQVVKMMIKRGRTILNSKLLLLGLTFKENVNDMRNSKAKELIKELEEFGIEVEAFDPYLTKEEVIKEFNINNLNTQEFQNKKEEYKGIILVTSHKEFLNLNYEMLKFICKEKPIFYDVRAISNKEKIEEMGFLYKKL